MKYVTVNKIDFILELLPWPFYIPKNADKLILGTFPTIKEKRYFDFFYPNIQNNFWDILSEITRIKLLEKSHNVNLVNERKVILDRLNLGIGDLGHKIIRTRNSSSDFNIIPIEYSNIFQVLEDHVSINKLILTSSTGPNSAYSWFKDYCKLNNIDFKFEKKDKLPKVNDISFSGRKVNVIAVNSTSRASSTKVEEIRKQFEYAFNY